MNEQEFHPELTTFSKEYRLVRNAEVITAPGDLAEMGYEMWDALARRFGKHFLGMVEGLHYQFEPAKNIPAGTVVVPKQNHDDPEALLVQR
jgi:hypothetical protein